jgi:hypothetical protein
VKKSAKLIVQASGVVVLLGAAWFIGYFQAWHNSLSKQFAGYQTFVVLNTHYLKALRANNCLDPRIEKEISGQVQAHLAFAMTGEYLSQQSIFWTLKAPVSWLSSTREWHDHLSVDELLRRAEASGVDTREVRQFRVSLEPASLPPG